MALEEFENEELSDREKNIVKMRSIVNYTMGLFFIGVGFLFMFPMKAIAPRVAQYDPTMIKIFAILCWVYGLFRIYRGYRKNYFRNS